MKFQFFFCSILVIGVLLTACKTEPEKKSDSFEPVSNGMVINSSPREVESYVSGSQGNELRIGWNIQGHAMRAFLSFDVSSILPAEDEEMTIDRAVLKVYESNTNLHPFDGDDETRTVEVALLDYGTLSGNDFDREITTACGTIAEWGYSTLEEHSLTVTNILSDLYSLDPANLSQVQFRLQFTDDDNITDLNNSVLDGSMWNIFAVEEGGDYVPVLEINYTISEKDD